MQWPGKEKEKQKDFLRKGIGIPSQILNSWGKSVISQNFHFTPAPPQPKIALKFRICLYQLLRFRQIRVDVPRSFNQFLFNFVE